jgi:hypothetical protein
VLEQFKHVVSRHNKLISLVTCFIINRRYQAPGMVKEKWAGDSSIKNMKFSM